MDVLFLSTRDLRNSRYVRINNKNLLETRFGTADTLAFCGRLEEVGNTRYGPRLRINDGDSLSVIVGTFNENVRRDAEAIVKKFRESDGDIYLLMYGNPYETDKLYINVNQDNGVIVVDKGTYDKFHDMRKSAQEYLRKKYDDKLPEIRGKEISDVIRDRIIEEDEFSLSNSAIIEFIRNNDEGDGVPIDDIFKFFGNFDREVLEERIFELMEMGYLYEPKSRVLKVIE